jgi:pilus assembly protein CpaF
MLVQDRGGRRAGAAADPAGRLEPEPICSGEALMSLLRRVERAQQELAQREAQRELEQEGPTTRAFELPPDRPADASADRAMVPVMAPRPPAPRNPAREALILDLRHRLIDEVITAFDTLLDVDATDVRGKIEGIVDRTIERHGFAVTRDERTRLVDELADDVTGFGPLEALLHDDTITEVMVNGPSHVYVERAGKIQRIESSFLNDEHVLRIIDRIITPMGRRIDEMSPRVDARLPDGSRVNAIVEPLSLVGPVITVRKFSARPYTVDDLVRFGTATADMFDFMRACVEARLNIFVSGGTGSGKTTTLNVLSSFIPNDERIVTIEDAAELQLRQEHVVTLESRPPNIEGKGAIPIRELVRNSLRMRPDRIIVGECRAGEALDMLQAMNTGHDGSMSTGHANSPRDMLSRLETMVLMAGVDLPVRAIREQIASAVDLIVQQSRLKDGTRKIVNITEVQGMEGDVIVMQDVFVFEQTGIVEGKIQGRLKATGIRPKFVEKFEVMGIHLPPGLFGFSY